MSRKSILSGLAAAAFLILIAFQHCGRVADNQKDSPSSLTLANTGNGLPYDGKPYINRALACSDNQPSSVLDIVGQVVRLVRDQCQNLPQPVVLNPSDYVYYASRDAYLFSNGGFANSANTNKCGNGNMDPGEECDDGNQVDNDTCTNVCLVPVFP